MRPRLLGSIVLPRNTPDGAAGSPQPAAPEPAPSGEAKPPAPPAPPEPVASPAAAPATPTAVPAAKPDWRDARIAELTAKYNAEKAKAAVAPAAPAAPSGPSEAEIAERIQTEAQRLAQASAWNDACNAVASQGNKKFPDFGERLRAIQGTVNGQDPGEVTQYNEVLSAAIETGRGAEVLHQLGANPGEVTRLMKLSPVKRAMEIATMAAKLDGGGAPEPSGAPAPITPIGSRGVHYDGIKPDDPNNGTKLPTAEWMKQREAQAIERGIQ